MLDEVPRCRGEAMRAENFSGIRRRRVCADAVGVKVEEEFSVVMVVAGDWRRHHLGRVERDGAALLRLRRLNDHVSAGDHLAAGADGVVAGCCVLQPRGPAFRFGQESGEVCSIRCHSSVPLVRLIFAHSSLKISLLLKTCVTPDFRLVVSSSIVLASLRFK